MSTTQQQFILGEGSPRPLLSILTATVPSRWDAAGALARKILAQIEECAMPVEHLVLCDNRARTIGEKRDALLRAARGLFVAYVDDDDDVAENYVRALATAAAKDPAPDVITFKQLCIVNGQEGLVEFRLGSPNDPWQPNTVIRRNAWHVCAWRRDLAILAYFPPVNYDEDTAFCRMLWSVAGLREEHLPEVLHYYRHAAAQTLSAHPYLASDSNPFA